MSAHLFNALAHSGEAVASSQLPDPSAVVYGADFHYICRLD
jgi:hypothetical protein